MAVRRAPRLSDKLAAVILLHLGVPHKVAKRMTTNEILALVEFDHYPVRFETARDLGWSDDEINHPSNLQPLFPEDHAIKTAKIDIPAAAKSKRLTAAHDDTRRKLLTKAGIDDAPEPPAGRRPPRKMKGPKLKGRGFPGHRRMNGKPIWKDKA